MRKSISDDYCSENARLDAVRKTETASTATNNQGKDVAYENLFRKKYKVLKNMTTEKQKKKQKTSYLKLNTKFYSSNFNKYSIPFNSSKIANLKLSSVYQVNIRCVLASLSIGRAGLSKFCSTMDSM